MIEETQHNIYVSNTSLHYLSTISSIPDQIAKQIQALTLGKEEGGQLRMSKEDLRELREILIDEMAVVGFDEKYDLSVAGHIYEDLIERLWLIYREE